MVSELIKELENAMLANRRKTEIRLVSLGETAVKGLIEALQHENKLVRLHAASALGKIKDPRAIVR